MDEIIWKGTDLGSLPQLCHLRACLLSTLARLDKLYLVPREEQQACHLCVDGSAQRLQDKISPGSKEHSLQLMCVLCNSNPEDYDHIFSECSYSISAYVGQYCFNIQNSEHKSQNHCRNASPFICQMCQQQERTYLLLFFRW